LPPALPTPGFLTHTPTIKQEPYKALARIVVAGMKARGVKDYRTKPEDADGPGKEEYKNIYHHTLKAAVFALVSLVFYRPGRIACSQIGIEK
jgi:hypothetical protein